MFLGLANWPVGWFCAGIRPFKNYLVAFGLTRNTIAYPWEIRWSASTEAGGVPSTWVAAPGNDAGNTNALAGTTDHIVDMIQLGNINVIYKNNSVWTQQWIGGNQIFAHRVAFREFGMISANCAREVFSKQVVLTQDDVVIHNLVEAKSLVDNDVVGGSALGFAPSRTIWLRLDSPATPLHIRGRSAGAHLLKRVECQVRGLRRLGTTLGIRMPSQVLPTTSLT